MQITVWEKEDRSGSWGFHEGAGTPLKKKAVATGKNPLQKGVLTEDTPFLTLVIPDTSSQAPGPLAVLQGRFKLLLPLHNTSELLRRRRNFNTTEDPSKQNRGATHPSNCRACFPQYWCVECSVPCYACAANVNIGFFGGTESGVSVLEYIPAPRVGKLAGEWCFTARSPPLEEDLPLTPSSEDLSSASTALQNHKEMQTGTRVDSAAATVGKAASKDTPRPVVFSFTDTQAGTLPASGTLGPTFELLPAVAELACDSFMEPGHPSIDQAQQEAAHLFKENAGELLTGGSFLPLHAEAIVQVR